MSKVDTPPSPRISGEHPMKETVRQQLREFNETTLTEMTASREALQGAMIGVSTLAPPTSREGEWVIIIRGRGPHHNADERDANRRAMSFIRDLREHGHDVVGASFDAGVQEDLPLPEETSL